MNQDRKDMKDTLGLFAPDPNQGVEHPGPAIAEIAWQVEKTLFPLFLAGAGEQANWHICRFRARRLKAAIPDALHPVKIGEIGRGQGRRLLLADSRQLKAAWWPASNNMRPFPSPISPIFIVPESLAIFRTRRSTRNFLGYTHQLTSRGVCPGTNRR